MTSPPSRPWQIPYYQWSWAERCAVIPIQEDAYRSGRLQRPTYCCICLASGPAWMGGRPQFIGHLERYDRPLNIYPVCRRCHASLHARYGDPARWRRALGEHGRPGEWFTLLSSDPAKQWWRFEAVYPDGLPGPTGHPDQRSLFDML